MLFFSLLPKHPSVLFNTTEANEGKKHYIPSCEIIISANINTDS